MSVGEVAGVLESKKLQESIEEKCQTKTTVINASCEFNSINELENWKGYHK